MTEINKTIETALAGEGQPQAVCDALAKAFAQTVCATKDVGGDAKGQPGSLLKPITDDLAAAKVIANATVSHKTPHQNKNPAAIDAHLDGLLAAMPASPLADAIRPLLNRIVWYQIFNDEHIEPGLANGLLAGQIIGGRGILAFDGFVSGNAASGGTASPGTPSTKLVSGEPASGRTPSSTTPSAAPASTGLYLGLFLLAYHVLSGEVHIRHGRNKSPMRVAAGQHSITPSNQVHELATGQSPCLIAYVWTGDIDDENWWWECDANGVWERVCWKRQADSSWRITRREPLSKDEIKRAGDG